MVDVSLSLADGGIVFAGLAVAGTVTLINKDLHDTVNVAWLSITSHCQCTFNKSRLNIPDVIEPQPGSSGSFLPTQGGQEPIQAGACARGPQRCRPDGCHLFGHPPAPDLCVSTTSPGLSFGDDEQGGQDPTVGFPVMLMCGWVWLGRFALTTAQDITFATLVLPKRHFRLGEDISGALSFTNSPGLACLKVNLGLERVEKPANRFCHEAAVRESTLTELHSVTQLGSLHAELTAFDVTVPLHVSPTFYCEYGMSVDACALLALPQSCLIVARCSA
ncbi:uncharacterized protein MONBRDRAFT_5392 [Monosiga brevicollis MX1]|uniref:Uncharacterized protein n=1 Tax=Monosiga brevicollis TaxID=81824 RepID=A9UQU8_MONBE|nr:uncharacterized protein MONBRDRAFT_5392 [Monosiga brevicollis MX1]EDQ93108.1 predicted protein [Monosiga brevicollis MX1]|eukprot:XP_001742870.1 hypothetical protein [Monosiga brevicollis MX1]